MTTEREKLASDFTKFIETATDQQKAAIHCLFDAISDVMKTSMKDCGLFISLISEADLLGHRPVTYWTNLTDTGKITHLEYTLQRIRKKRETSS
jgi:hypothetical protein